MRSRSPRRRASGCARRPTSWAGPKCRLIDLLHVAVDDVRQGGDPRLPLRLALVEVTRPGADLSRVGRLPPRATRIAAARRRATARAEPSGHAGRGTSRRGRGPAPTAEPRRRARARRSTSARSRRPGSRRSCPRSRSRSRPTSVLTEAKPIALDGERLVLEFPQQPRSTVAWPRAEERRRPREPLHEVTGHRLALAFEVGEGPHEEPEATEEKPATEDEIISLMKTTFDAREIEEGDGLAVIHGHEQDAQPGPADAGGHAKRRRTYANERVEASVGGGMVTVTLRAARARSSA